MALKTNSKKAKENIKKYLRETAGEFFADNGTESEQIDTELYSLIWGYFVNTYAKGDYRYGRMNTQDLFEHWAQGLPMGATFDYYLSTAVDTLGDILEETEDERSRYNQDAAEKLLTGLIYREVRGGANA